MSTVAILAILLLWGGVSLVLERRNRETLRRIADLAAQAESLSAVAETLNKTLTPGFERLFARAEAEKTGDAESVTVRPTPVAAFVDSVLVESRRAIELSEALGRSQLIEWDEEETDPAFVPQWLSEVETAPKAFKALGWESTESWVPPGHLRRKRSGLLDFPLAFEFYMMFEKPDSLKAWPDKLGAYLRGASVPGAKRFA